MHESHQVQHVVDEAQKMLAGRGLARASRVSLLIGEALGFDEMSVRLHWEEFVTGTALEGAELAVCFVPAQFKCPRCGKFFPKKGSLLSCPACNVLGSPTDLGREFKIESIE